MKRFLALALLFTLLAPHAYAAPKSIPAQLGSIFSAPVDCEGFAQSGKNTVYLQNRNEKSGTIVLTALDLSGNQLWQRVIDSGVDEVAGAITSDPSGNIWVAGAAATQLPLETATPIAGIDNPDGVVLEPGESLRSDMNQIALWKVAPTGEILATYLSPQKSTPSISAISATNSGVSIIGVLDSKPFFASFSAGVFGKLLFIGTAKTEINAVARNSDGTSSLFGSSSEALSGKKVAGIRDGILAKVSKAGVITSLVRSSAIKASRSWISGDTSHLVSGPVITGKITETAITKFSSTFTPTWTQRIPSAGASTTLSANGNSYLAFTSRTAIVGVSGFKPLVPTLLVLTFDSKGVLKAATALPGLITPLSLQYSAGRGVVGLASSSDGTVSIFTLVSR